MRGSGRVFQRKNSPWWWIAYYHRGQEQREIARQAGRGKKCGEKLTATESNREKAERFLQQRLEAVTTEEGGGPAFTGPAAQRLTVNELLDALRDDYQLRGKWGARVESLVKKLREYFGLSRAVTVTSERVAAFQLELRAEGYRDASINRFCQVLGQAFRLAVERKHLAGAPVIQHLSEVGNARSGFFTEQEIRSLLAHLPEHLQDFTLFAYITGMRKGEVQSLRWSDVHGDSITLRAENSKNGESRTIPLEGELAELMERCRARRQMVNGTTVMLAEYIFHHQGAPIGSFRKTWASACRFAGVPGRLFHDLRRCAARNLLAAGVPQAVAMKITGHRTDSMFRRYAIITDTQQRQALRQAEAYRLQQAGAQPGVQPGAQRATTIN